MQLRELVVGNSVGWLLEELVLGNSVGWLLAGLVVLIKMAVLVVLVMRAVLDAMVMTGSSCFTNHDNHSNEGAQCHKYQRPNPNNHEISVALYCSAG